LLCLFETFNIYYFSYDDQLILLNLFASENINIGNVMLVNKFNIRFCLAFYNLVSNEAHNLLQNKSQWSTVSSTAKMYVCTDKVDISQFTSTGMVLQLIQNKGPNQLL